MHLFVGVGLELCFDPCPMAHCDSFGSARHPGDPSRGMSVLPPPTLLTQCLGTWEPSRGGALTA